MATLLAAATSALVLCSAAAAPEPPLINLPAADPTGPSFHFGVGNGLLPGGMGDPQLYWDEPTKRFHIQPQYSPATVPPYHPTCKAHSADGWGHATSPDLLGDFTELPIPFGPCAISPKLDMYSSAGTGCTLRINATHVGSLVNGDTSTGWETTNNFAAVCDSGADPTLTNWTQISHGIEGNHSAGEPRSWAGTPGNHIPAPFGLIGNVIAYHNSSDSTGSINAVVSTSVGDPRAKTSLPAFMVYSSADFASWTYAGPLYTHTKEMNRAECGDLFPIGAGASKITAANVDFGLAAGDAWWVLMWSTPDRNGGASARNAGVVYLIGKLTGGKFVPASEELQAADYGSGFYASQSVLGPGDERIIMADLGGGVQSLPRRITLTESDMSLNFAPVSALAARHAGTPVRASGVKLVAGDSKQLVGADAFADAMDINVTVSGEAGGSAVVRLRAGNSSTRCRCTHESAWCCKDGPIELMVNFTGNASSPRPMHSLTVTAGRGKITIPVDGSGGAQGGTLRSTMRVVIDKQIVEVFTGQTPYSFSYMPLSGGRDVELLAVSGAAEFDVVASEVATTKRSPKTDDLSVSAAGNVVNKKTRV